MEFNFLLPTQIIFGERALERAIPRIRPCGRHALFLHGRNKERASGVMHRLRQEGMALSAFAQIGEPTLEAIEKLAVEALKARCDCVIAMGGGSVIDAGKAVAAALTNPPPLRPYLEVVGEGRPLMETPAPFVAIPTTAGTGAEVTRNAVLAVPSERVKVSLRSPLMYPDLAVVDPSYTVGLPQEISAACGLDALTQLIEAFVSKKATPMTDGLCREGLRRAGRSFERILEAPEDLGAREDMALASLLSGIALANAGLGAVHGLAGPMGGFFNPSVPHGAICARLLPEVMERNLARATDTMPAVCDRFGEIARYLGAEEPTPESAIRAVRCMLERSSLRGMAHFGFSEKHFPEITTPALRASSMKGNPVDLNTEELMTILQKSLHDPDHAHASTH
jgi:alcohol dehydrogenase class IV